jgi:uncharacterized protein (TIGR02246 family)
MQTCRKLVLTLLFASWIAGCGAEQNENSDEKAIRNIVQSYQEAYNRQDAEKLAAEWTSDATYINPVTGESAEGKEAIKKLFKEKFAQAKRRQLKITIKNIEFPNANEAIERGVMEVTAQDQPVHQVAYKAEYVRENGKWLINAMGEIELQNPASHFEQLKDLSWLVGKWEDSDDNVAISFNNQWDKYKNFIVQHFRMKVYGQDNIEGKQIIAWDPVNEQVRSWVFDSDGGFGEGTWEKVNNSWIATMQFTLSDGRVATSINIYTPVDAKSYTFASEEREVDGEVLPDMNPVTVEKIE